MKNWIVFLLILALASCNSQKKYSDFQISYSRSGGMNPIYENMLIKGKKINYSFEGQGEKYTKKANISTAEKQKLYDVAKINDLKNIQDDVLKLYDNITTTIKIKGNGFDIFKNDGSGIRPGYETKWQNIVNEFEALIKSKNLRK